MKIKKTIVTMAAGVACLGLCAGVTDNRSDEYAFAVVSAQDADSVAVLSTVKIEYGEFVTRMLPATVRALTPSAESLKSLTDPRWLVYQVSSACMASVDRDLSGIKAHTAAGGLVVWTMPKPLKPGEPRYICFVPDKTGYRVFTLERSFLLDTKHSETYEIWEVINDPEGESDHINYEVQLDANCTARQFAKAVNDLLALQKAMSTRSK